MKFRRSWTSVIVMVRSYDGSKCSKADLHIRCVSLPQINGVQKKSHKDGGLPTNRKYERVDNSRTTLEHVVSGCPSWYA
jgi:hypothetical protein